MVNKIIKSTTWLVMLVFASAGFAGNALAAPLNYNNNTTVTLTSPATSLTILAGSQADSVVVGAGSVSVTISPNEEFKMTSASYDFTVSGNTATVSSYPSCTSAGVATFDIRTNSAAQTVTATPTASQCVVSTASAAIGTLPTATAAAPSSGGGGGSSYTPAPTVQPTVSSTPAPAVTPSAPAMSPQDQLNALLTQLHSLQSQAAGSATLSNMPAFKKNLSFGSVGSDVKWLQIFLINQAKGSAAGKLQKAGANGRFGPLTVSALKEFQKSVGIKPASGILGPLTKAFIKSVVK